MVKDIKGLMIDENSFLAGSSDVIGDVRLGKNSSIWFGSVVRGDLQPISVGENSNIQDNATIHVGYNEPCIIGDDVSIGHNAVVHGCVIGDNTLVGMGAIVLSNAEVGKNCLIAAGALVTGGMVVPDNSLVVGVPGKIVRELREEEIRANRDNAKNYLELWKERYV